MSSIIMNTTAVPHITMLRQQLLDTLADLRNRDNPMEPDRARAVAQVATVLVDSAKVEVDYIRATGADTSSFLALPSAAPALPAPNTVPAAHNPFPVSKRHTLEG